MISVGTFVNNVNEIKAENPRYGSGGVGSDGECDCVGAVMGAMYRAGHDKYPMHSSNYFAREQMVDLQPITANDLFFGMLVYKGRSPGESGYDLNARYQSGGRYYNGDSVDYYHIGVVTSLNPLIITHCTKYDDVDGFVEDTKLGKWQYGGHQNDVDYERSEIMSLANKTCVVTGGDLKLRPNKSTKGVWLALMPEGAEVIVTADDGTWATVAWYSEKKGKTIDGYAMSEFLSEKADTESGTEDAAEDNATASGVVVTGSGVWIPTPTPEYAATLAAILKTAETKTG